jgi:hypothetical protein
MATPLSATKLRQILAASGVSYRARVGWGTHDRGQRGDGWGITEKNPTGVHGVMIHHTGKYTTEAGILGLLWSGYEGLPGPLCHGGITKGGVVHLMSAGRANHAGTGDHRVLERVIREDYTTLPLPRFAEGDPGGIDGNARFYGFELLNQGDGRDPWPDVQVEAAVKAAAAICHAHGWNERSVIGHKEWQRGKPDPRDLGMSLFRAQVNGELARLKVKEKKAAKSSGEAPF